MCRLQLRISFGCCSTYRLQLKFSDEDLCWMDLLKVCSLHVSDRLRPVFLLRIIVVLGSAHLAVIYWMGKNDG